MLLSHNTTLRLKSARLLFAFSVFACATFVTIFSNVPAIAIGDELKDHCAFTWDLIEDTIDINLLKKFSSVCNASPFHEEASERLNLLAEALRGAPFGFAAPKTVHTEKIRP